MMKAHLLPGIGGIALVLAVGRPVAAAQRPVVAFEAELVTTVTTPDGQTRTTVGTVRQGSDGSVREDTRFESRIMNRTTRRLAVLNHATKEAYEQAAGARPPTVALPSTITPANRASVVIDGRSVWQQVTEIQPGVTSEVWIDLDTGAAVVLKLTSPTVTLTKTLRNITRRVVPASVFVVPPGYARRSAPTRDEVPASFLGAQFPGLTATAEPLRRPQ